MNTVSETRAKKAAAAVNQIKATTTELLTTELIVQLRKNGCPYPQTLPKILEKQGLITKKKGVTTFVHAEPVFYGLLANGLDKAAKDIQSYIAKSIEKKQEKTSASLSDIPTLQLINELKTRGEFAIHEKVIQIITH